MAKNTSIILGDHFSDFIDGQLEVGRYGSTSEIVRAGLRLLEEQELKLKKLQGALLEGENSGKPVSFNFNEFLKDKNTKK